MENNKSNPENYTLTTKMKVVMIGTKNQIVEKIINVENFYLIDLVDDLNANWIEKLKQLDINQFDLLIFNFTNKLTLQKINALNSILHNLLCPLIVLNYKELPINLFDVKITDKMKMHHFYIPGDEEIIINQFKKYLVEFRSRLKLKLFLERFNDTISAIHDCIILIDENERVLYANDSAKKIFSNKEQSDIPIDLFHLVNFIDIKTDHIMNEQVKADVKKNMKKKYAGLVKLRQDSSEENYFELMLSPFISENNQHIGCTLILHNVSDLLKLTRELNYAATHDQLTKTFNKSYLLNKANELINDGKRTSEKFSLLFFDLDGFKTINDTLGHQAGDQLLVSVAQRLLSSIRATDICARVGGDEFIVLLKNIKSESYAAKVAKNIIDQISFRFDINHQEVFISASIGIACYPNDGDHVDVLIKHADIALYAAKEAGKNTQIFYDPILQERYVKALRVIQGLNSALLNNEFELFLQPIMMVDDKRCRMVEALIRWNQADSVIVQANEFIAIAEESGFIKKIDLWVLENALIYLKNEVIIDNDIQIAINMSGVTLSEKNITHIIIDKIKKHGIDTKKLHIEIAENSFVRNRKVLSGAIQEFRQAGIQIAIDDFGTGYANLVQLRQFPVDFVKIDRVFIAEIEQSEKDFYVVRALVALATALDIRVIAEGVETLGQYQKIKACDCYAYQGYFYAKPMSLLAFKEFIDKDATDRPNPY